jgi:hypothetical protein
MNVTKLEFIDLKTIVSSLSTGATRLITKSNGKNV